MTRSTAGPAWSDFESHHRWLRAEEERLLRFHEQHALEDSVGFAPLDRNGEPERESPRELYATARIVHCFALAHLGGRPGAAAIAEHGLRALTHEFLDEKNDGWFASVSQTGAVNDDTKSAYAHAFVVLAASTAMQSGLAGGEELLAHADRVIDAHFWREDEGAVVDAFSANWDLLEPGYRGQNANMHLTEAYLGAYEVTADKKFLRRAERISELIVARNGERWNWRVPEHFDADWSALPDYNIDKPADPFRPYGSLVGHWLEWARLVLQLYALSNAGAQWAPAAARGLFAAAVRDGWDQERGGLVYSVDVGGMVVNAARMHWAMAEAVGAAVALFRQTGDAQYEGWYREFWSYISRCVLDRRAGSWWHELDASGAPAFDTWPGKPDLYHAYQATLYARADAGLGLAAAARGGRIR
ncbi:MAG: sulfoquinovose isomerase [Microbacteriaceae bacterium]|jgi:mannose/cellobiose epimerase-like protein (N-acyl-D-glucosamine 2-epimerase family)|nr:sulfoquinovose isomerase [Microbacteriaceae bacterium]